MSMIQASPQFYGKVYGIELEIEAAGLYEVDEHYDEETDEYTAIDPIVPQGWLREQEDSIVGVELISDRPYTFEESVINIQRVFMDITRQGYMPLRTPRGSTHVHANVADLTWDQMRHFVAACAWAEPALIELAGKGRKGNLFAQSYETTPLGWGPVIEWCRRKEFFQNLDTHYMATSFFPMSYLGSVEFRMGPSSRNASDAIWWLQCIDTVVEAGRTLPINGYEEPAFLDVLLAKMDHKKQTRLRQKGARFAAEVWDIILEPYNPPPKINFSKLNKGLSAAEGAMSSLQVSVSLPSGWLTPLTPTEENVFPFSNIDCSDPTCPICHPAPVTPTTELF